jgi:hypothetical protein
MMLSGTVGILTQNAHAESDEETWGLLQTVVRGDAYMYDVCDWQMRNEYTGKFGGCYTISLSFLDHVRTEIGDYLVAIATVYENDSGESTQNLFLIDVDTFAVKNVDSKQHFAKSISDTVLWIGKFTPEIVLKEGTKIATLGSYFPEGADMMVRSKTISEGEESYVIGYSVLKDSSIVINPRLAMPTSGTVYSTTNLYPAPQKLFEFKLSSFQSANGLVPNMANLDNGTSHAPSFDESDESLDDEVSAPQKVIPQKEPQKTSEKLGKYPSVKNQHYRIG